MKVLGRGDLIFPIHYVDIERIGKSDTTFGEELALLLRPQWIDFRPLQFEDVKSSKVRQWADALAASVVRAMKPGVSVTKVYGGSSSPLQRESRPATAGSASPANRASPAPAPESHAAHEPDTWAPPASNSRSPSPWRLSLTAATARSLFTFAARLGAAAGKAIKSNLGEVAGKACVAAAAFSAIGLVSYNFDLNLIQYMVNQSTALSTIGVAYGCALIAFAFVKSRAILAYITTLVACYFFLFAAMPAFYDAAEFRQVRIGTVFFI